MQVDQSTVPKFPKFSEVLGMPTTFNHWCTDSTEKFKANVKRQGQCEACEKRVEGLNCCSRAKVLSDPFCFLLYDGCESGDDL